MGLNIELLESSFNLVAPKGEALVNRFYERLFKKYPSVKPMFKKTTMKEQKKKLLASLVLVIQNLRHPDKLTGALQQLGARHVAYGTKPAHYDAVGENLLAVLEEFAGAAWTPAVKQAWTDAYGAIKTIMLAGAQRAQYTQGGTIMSKGKKNGAATGMDMGSFCMSALDNSQTNMLMCDRNLVVTYINKAAQGKLKGLETEIRKVLPSFNADTIVGTCIDGFHKDPSKQRRILDNPASLPYKGDIQLGPLTLNLIVSAITSQTGDYLGNSLEWEDVTEKRKLETEMARIKTALDNTSTNVMVCDRTYTIVYVNKASVTTLRRREEEVRKVFPNFSVDKVVGSCIDGYHKNPAHQRQLLDNPKNLPYRSEIKVGSLTLDLNAAAIINERGEYVGNVVEWSDITAQKKAQVEIDKLINAAATGQLSERINAEEFDGFFKNLSQGVNKMLDAVITPLHEAQMVLTAMAANDLTKQMTGSYEGEFDQMKTSLNGAIQTLGTALTIVREGAESVTAGAEQITKGNEDLSQRTSEQASALEETSASMEEMTSTVKQNADNAKQANQLAITARDIADKGGSVTVRAVEAMGEINKSSKKIADIITVIDEIAFQTNLLALNAAVEAARAGEHGRGFAVVAAEVRNLAQRSATAAKEIKGLINESIQRVSDGSELVNQSGKTLEEIVSSVKRVTDIIAEITAASQEQASGIDQVNKAIMQMDETTQQNAALVEETTSASQSMTEQAKELMSQVEVFKTPAGEGHPAPRRDSASASKPASKLVAAGNRTKPELKKPGFASKASTAKAPVGVGAGNGHDRRRKDDDFEEF
jgi:methyl-accepting chemotaxis protein